MFTGVEHIDRGTDLKESVNASCVYSVTSLHKISWFSLLPYFSLQHMELYVQLTHSSLGDWEDIFVTQYPYQNRKYQHFPLLSYFPLVVCPRWWYHRILSVDLYMYIMGKLGFCFHYFCAVCDVYKYLKTLRPRGLKAIFVCLQITLYHPYRHAIMSGGTEHVKCLSL